MSAMMQTTTIETSLGRLSLVADDDALVAVYFPGQRPTPRFERSVPVADHRLLRRAGAELVAYLSGELTTFTVPFVLRGTPFQRRVWSALLTIPRSETRTYGELAQSIGRPTAARAIGHSVARNPLSIIVPCHRVIGADGSLTGFAGGLERKAALLAIERAGATSAAARRGAPSPRRELGQ